MSIINYSELSRLLTGETGNIRQNYVPNKHKERVKQLETLVNQWINQEYTPIEHTKEYNLIHKIKDLLTDLENL